MIAWACLPGPVWAFLPEPAWASLLPAYSALRAWTCRHGPAGLPYWHARLALPAWRCLPGLLLTAPVMVVSSEWPSFRRRGCGAGNCTRIGQIWKPPASGLPDLLFLAQETRSHNEHDRLPAWACLPGPVWAFMPEPAWASRGPITGRCLPGHAGMDLPACLPGMPAWP